MKILLTGGTGYIGSHTAIELIKQGYEVEILDNLFNSKITVLDDIEVITGVKPKFYKVDLMDARATEKVIVDGKYDIVIHFAGLKAVGESVEKPLLYYKNNIGGTINLLEAMLKHQVNKIIFSSSATVYGDQDGVKLTEEMQTGVGITNPYGQTKFMIEQILKDVTVAHPEFNVTILRYFNPVGAHESGLIGENPNDIPNNLMPIVMKVATGEIAELKIYGDDYDTPDGTGMRDFIHVVDLAKGHVKAVDKMKPGVSVYNLGTGEATSVMEMVKAFEKASGTTLPYKIATRRAGDLAKIFADASKAERELGWKPELTIEDAMRDTINYLNHYKKIMTKNPLISIVIPVYNIEDYILKCLKSVAGQSYENLEIIVVDDGSTDESGKICDEFAKNDKRVKVCHKKNGGLSSARNYGIKKARGEIMALVDGDDYVDSDYVAMMYDAMVKENAEIVICGYNEHPTEGLTMSGREAAVKLLVYQGNLDVVAWNKLYLKKLFIENEIWYPLGEKHEDALTTYKLLATAKKVTYVRKPLYNYVEREGSIMNGAKKEERLKMREMAALEAVKYFRDDKDLQQAAKIAVLTAKYAYIDNAISGEIPHSYLMENMKWVREHIREYDNNKYMTKKLKLYNKLCKNSATGFFYKIFRKIKHE